MKNPHYYHEFLCNSCGKNTIKHNKDKIKPKYCSALCSQKGRIGYKLDQRKSIDKVIASFNKRAVKGSKCWEWKGYINRYGYAILSSRYLKEDKAHRISYIIHKGEIPEGHFILHSCHNKSCTNPKHLRAGTHKENMQDKVTAFRQHFGIDENKIKAIQMIIKSNVFSDDEVAKIFKVTKNCILAIKTSKSALHTRKMKTRSD